MSNNYQHHSFDAVFLVSGRSITFIAASIISAFINLFFIGNLSKEVYSIGNFAIPTAFFLSIMSVTLECSKLFHVIQYNTLNELYHKLKDTRILKVSKQWFIGYIFYAVLAILSATFFSFNSLGTSQKASDSSFQYITEDYNIALSYIEEIKNMDNQLESLSKQKSDSSEIDKIYLDEIAPYIQKANEAISNNWKVLDSENNLVEDPFTKEWNTWYKNQIAVLGLKNFGITNGSQLRSKLDISLFRTIKQQSLDNEIKAVEELKANKQTELDEVYARNNVTTFRGLETEYRAQDKGRYSGGGTAAVFKLIGDMIHVDDSIIRCALLLFLSLLIELTIFQTSPKVQISRRMLYQFTQYLPEDFNVNKFMDGIDKELVDYDIIKVTKKDEKELIKADVELEKAEKRAKVAEAKARRSKAKKTERENTKSNDIVVKNTNIEKENILEKEEDLPMITTLDPQITPVENEEAPKEVVAEPVEEAPKVEPVKEVAKPKKPRKPRAKKAKPVETKESLDITPVTSESLPIEEPVAPKEEVAETPKEEPKVEVKKPVAEKPKVISAKKVSPKVEVPPKEALHNYRFGVAKKSVCDKMIVVINKLYENSEFKADTWKLATRESLASLDNIVSTEQVNILLQRLKAITYGKKFIVTEENGRFFTLFDKDALIKYVTTEIK